METEQKPDVPAPQPEGKRELSGSVEAVVPEKATVPFEKFSFEQRQQFRRTFKDPEFTKEQLASVQKEKPESPESAGEHQEPPVPLVTGPRPQKDDKNADGSWRYCDADGRLREDEFDRALTDWGRQDERATRDLEQRLEATAREHQVETKTLFDTAARFLNDPNLLGLAGYPGSSPDFTEILFILSDERLFAKLSETARTDQRLALRALFAIEEGVTQARARNAKRTAAREPLPPPLRRIGSNYSPEVSLREAAVKTDFRAYKNLLAERDAMGKGFRRGH